MEEELKIIIRPLGADELSEMRARLSTFVWKNFDFLYDCAIRIGCNIPDDYWAPRRIQIN